MAKRMLINALHPEETRVAIANDDKLLELEVERSDLVQLKGNIYKATIARIEPSLQAAFLDIGSQRNGFLQINDINHTYYNDWAPDENNSRPSIQDVLNPGQELVVQVVKDERDAKGATLTTNISIPGRFLVLMIGNQRGGVSRKIVDEKQRAKLRKSINNLRIPAGMGVIVRTAGINRGSSELQKDLDGLLDVWKDIYKGSLESGSPIVLYEESDLATRTIRDYFSSDIEEILIDEKKTYERTKQFVDRIMPSLSEKLKLYEHRQPLFSAFHLANEVDAINSPEVTLPSGGSIVVNTTEAVVAIDVNSGRSTSQADVEETAFATNKEAAVEIAKQLRLRDLGGLVVIDFIDMIDRRHKQSVERALKDELKSDRAKIEIGRISKFGLLEMSRQRMKSSVVSQNYVSCHFCQGRGQIRTPESIALEVLRKTECTISAGGVQKVKIRMSPASALLLLNNKRHFITKLENDTGATIVIYADGRMNANEYELQLDTGTVHTAADVGRVGRIKTLDGSPEGEQRKDNQDRDDRRRRGSGGRRNRRRSSSNNNQKGGRRRGGNRGNQNRRRGSGRRDDRGKEGSSDEKRASSDSNRSDRSNKDRSKSDQGKSSGAGDSSSSSTSSQKQEVSV